MSQHQEQRQTVRDRGRYAKMTPCPRCGKRRALEPAYTVRDGGTVRDDSPWGGSFICRACIKQESAPRE